ncbi:MAG: murein biosynthesis integral membrane protein MurJ [Planctomycetota bacterium]
MSTLRAASAISVVTLVSRILGLVRDTMMTHLLGTSWAMGAFTRAWAIPNLLRRLFGEGALSAALVPAFARARTRCDAEAKDLLAGVTGALGLGLTLLTVLVTVTCLLLPPDSVGLDPNAAGVPRHESGRLLLDLTLVLFPYVIPICLAATYAGVQNALGQFALPAASPVLLNVLWIGGIVAAGHLGLSDGRSVTMFVAAMLLVGGFAQLALGVVPLARRGFLPRPRLPRRGDASAAVFGAMAPTMLGLSVAQLSILVSQNLAEYLTGPGSSTHIYLANRLLLFPHALTALAAATAVFPTLSLLAAQGDLAGVKRKLDVAVHGTLILAFPAALGLWALSDELVSVAFVHGSYTEADAQRTALATGYLVAGLPFLSVAQLYARALYALADTRTPAIASVVLLAVNVVANLVFVLGFRMGTEGLTLATSLCSLLNAVWLRARLRTMLPSGRPSVGPMLRIVVASAGMTVAVAGSTHLVPAAGRVARAVWHLMLPVTIGIATYALLHVACGGRELLDLVGRRLRRSARR